MKIAPTALALTKTGFQLLMIGRRRQDITPEQYRDHYENVHIPLMKNLTGDTFPVSHVRHYVKRTEDPNGSADLPFPADVLMGTQADFEFDAVAILTWRDKAHFDSNWAFFEDEEFGKIISEDEAKFSEWVKGVFLQGTEETLG